MLIVLKNKETLKVGDFYLKCSIGKNGLSSKNQNKKAFLEAFKLNENPIDKNIDLNKKLSSIY